MQLVDYGAQDVYLTGNPQITFWKVTYRRHTNFAMESIEQTFNGQADFGRRVQCTISRNGDLAYRTYLQVTLPEINQNDATGTDHVYARWLDCPGEQMISMVEVEIGGQRIDRQYGDWMHIWNQMTLSKEQQSGYHKMVGNTTALTYICDPGFAAVNGRLVALCGWRNFWVLELSNGWNCTQILLWPYSCNLLLKLNYWKIEFQNLIQDCG